MDYVKAFLVGGLICLAVQAVGTEKGILNLNQVLELKEKYCGI